MPYFTLDQMKLDAAKKDMDIVALLTFSGAEVIFSNRDLKNFITQSIHKLDTTFGIKHGFTKLKQD